MRLFRSFLALAALASLAAAPVAAQQVVGASVRTTAPTYVNGETRPLSLDTSGSLRVTDTSEGTGTTAGDSLATTTAAGTDRALIHGLGSTAWDRVRTITGMTAGNGQGVLAVAVAPVSSSNTSVVGAARTSAGVALTLKASPGNFYEATVVAGASAGFVLIHNTANAPPDGAVTPRYCAPVAANQMVVIDAGDIPEWFPTGITITFSTTGCFTQTLSSAAFIRGRAL